MKRSALTLVVVGVTLVALGSPVGAQSRRLHRVVPAEVEVQEFVTVDLVAIVDYVHAIEVREVVEYVSSVQLGEYLASLYVPPPMRSTPSYSGGGGTTVGECTGFAIPDYIIQRESGGNPSAMNPSGAYGCAQTLLSHYSGGSCSGMDPYTIDGQRACVDKLSDGGRNLDPWAETR